MESGSEDFSPLWVRPRQAARISGIGVTKLYELLKTGRIDSRRLDGARLISVSSLKLLGVVDPPKALPSLRNAAQPRDTAR